MTEKMLSFYWDEIPVGKANAVDYDTLSGSWNMSKREVRAILHELSLFDNGDDYILIRSGRTKGFYKTDDQKEIEAFKKECLNKGRSVFAPVKKINRVLAVDGSQFSLENNLRLYREAQGLTQKDVCERLKDNASAEVRAIDIPILSRMENGVCLPTPMQLWALSLLYKTSIFELCGGVYVEGEE